MKESKEPGQITAEESPSIDIPRAREAWKRRQWIIDPKLQYSLIAASALFGFLVLILFYAMTARVAVEFSREVGSLHLTERERLIVVFDDLLHAFRFGIFIGFLGFSAMFSFFILKFSNRIAGPIFNLRRSIRLAREQGEMRPVKFRKDDLLQDLGDEYNQLVEHLNARGTNSK